MTVRLPMRGRRPRLRMLATLCAVAAGLAACTGVPVSSTPETVQPLPRVNQEPAGYTPHDGEAPIQIVSEFLHDNSVDPREHAAARLYLTAAARNRWTDTTATIIADERVGTYQAAKKQIVVTGRIVGKLDADGVFTPYLQGSGGATQGAAVFVLGIQKVHGQFRISNPRQGLLLTADQFEQSYRVKPLYFFDLSNRYLVPDQRWSALQGVPLEEWLVGELANGPSDLLQSAVNSDTMPAQATTRNFIVSAGNPTRVEIPGSAQLEGSARNRLAAQVGTTLNDVMPAETFIITDGGRPVTIPAAGSVRFTQSTFGRAQGPEPPTADVYYLRGGHIVETNGSPLNGRVNNGTYFFTSVALTRMTPGGSLTVAAVADGHQLLVGPQFRGLVKTGVHGDLSRPAWAPGWGEVWIGDGDKLYRVLAAHPARKPLEVPLPPEDVGSGRIVALQLSAEGTRIAVVIQGSNGVRRLYAGAVTRTGGKVRVDALDQVSPVGVSVDDVDWIEPLELVAIGEHHGDARIFSVNVDGSMWSESIAKLPGRPNYVTVTPGQQVWVSVGSGASATVWEQQNTETWQSPGRIGQTPGTAPQYLE